MFGWQDRQYEGAILEFGVKYYTTFVLEEKKTLIENACINHEEAASKVLLKMSFTAPSRSTENV